MWEAKCVHKTVTRQPGFPSLSLFPTGARHSQVLREKTIIEIYPNFYCYRIFWWFMKKTWQLLALCSLCLQFILSNWTNHYWTKNSLYNKRVSDFYLDITGTCDSIILTESFKKLWLTFIRWSLMWLSTTNKKGCICSLLKRNVVGKGTSLCRSSCKPRINGYFLFLSVTPRFRYQKPHLPDEKTRLWEFKK